MYQSARCCQRQPKQRAVARARDAPGHPQVITHGFAGARADLELPLRRHDLGVDARDGDAGVHARAVVRLDHVASVDFAGACPEEARVSLVKSDECSQGRHAPTPQ